MVAGCDILETRCGLIRMREDQIVRLHIYENAHINAADAAEMMKAMEQFESNKIRLLIFPGYQQRMDKEATEALRSAPIVDRAAIVAADQGQDAKQILNSKPEYPVKLFESTDVALAWLKTG